MSTFDGMRSLAYEVASRPAQDELIRQAEQTRLLNQRNKQAMLDKRLADAAIAGRQNKYGGTYESLVDLNDPAMVAALAGMGADHLAGTRAQGVSTQNQARDMGLETLKAALQSGEQIPADIMNAFTGIAGDKMLGPSNVQVQRQAEADIGAANASTRQRDAMAEFSNARAANVGSASGGRSGGGSVKRLPVAQLNTMLAGMGFDGPSMPAAMQEFNNFVVDGGYNSEYNAMADYAQKYPQGGYKRAVPDAFGGAAEMGGFERNADPAEVQKWMGVFAQNGQDGKSEATAINVSEWPQDVAYPEGAVFFDPATGQYFDAVSK